MKLKWISISICLLISTIVRCQPDQGGQSNDNSKDYIQFVPQKNYFPVAVNKKATPMLIGPDEFSGVKKITKLFQVDIFNVTGANPEVHEGNTGKLKNIIIVGTLGKNDLIGELVNNGKLDVSDLQGKWEASLIQVIDQPFDNIERALVIVGSDKRGTMYGMFDFSEKIGVSPWYWWADVPVKKHDEVYVKPGRHYLGGPKVKYRGIFLNDEEPALGRWVVENYGGFTHEFYEKVFELLLRLKGNYLWPAMWWASFNSDDTLNPVLADEYGIVMSTSHHEPMMRAHAEWKEVGKGEWNYETNAGELREFWKKGIERMGDKESVVTLAMRGDGDEAMSKDANIHLLEKIVADQREIIEDVTGNPAEETPQVWALYKEVQEYHDNGMKVPDDVTLLLCDDNWGNIRNLPDLNAPKRKGGYGMYYHFDFVGGPRSYKWLNVTHISRTWEQMNLCYQYGVDKIWLVNVGDLKPMELPISFFLDYAWDPEKWPASSLMDYHKKWAAGQFGKEWADPIAEILWLYTKYNRRRTPEMLDANTYSLTNYNEFQMVTDEYDKLYQRSIAIYEKMEDDYKDAYSQLVHHPVWACSNLYKMYLAQAKNYLYQAQERAATNMMADKVLEYFNITEEIKDFYHSDLSDGKWDHMMAQAYIGASSWQSPQENILPKTKKIDIPSGPEMGVSFLGTRHHWSDGGIPGTAPIFDAYNNQSQFIEIFNKGKKEFSYTIESKAPWISFSKNTGKIKLQDTITVQVRWEMVKTPEQVADIILASENNEIITLKVKATKYNNIQDVKGFIENNGVVSINAHNYSKTKSIKDVSWMVVPGLSRTGSGITTTPVTRPFSETDEEWPSLEYEFYLFNAPNDNSVSVELNIAPTHNLTGKGLFYAIAIDDEEPQIINVHKENTAPDWNYPEWYSKAVGNYTIKTTSKHKLTNKGNHVLRLYMLSSGVVFQKIVIDNGGLRESYLGPPESNRK